MTGTVLNGAGPDSVDRYNLLAEFETQYGANLIGATVLRMRGVFAMVPATGGFNGPARIAATVEPVDTDTVTFGDGPHGSPYKDWMMFESFLNVNDPADLDNVTNRVLDVRSMRKLDEINEQLTLYVAASTSGVADTWNYAGDFSILLALP